MFLSDEFDIDSDEIDIKDEPLFPSPEDGEVSRIYLFFSSLFVN